MLSLGLKPQLSQLRQAGVLLSPRCGQGSHCPQAAAGAQGTSLAAPGHGDGFAEAVGVSRWQWQPPDEELGSISLSPAPVADRGEAGQTAKQDKQQSCAGVCRRGQGRNQQSCQGNCCMVQLQPASLQPPAYPEPALQYHRAVRFTERAEKLILGPGG